MRTQRLEHPFRTLARRGMLAGVLVVVCTRPGLSDTTPGPNGRDAIQRIRLCRLGPKTAMLLAQATTPERPPLPPLPDIHLSDIQPIHATNGWNGAPRRDLSIEDNPLRIRGEVFERGVGVHAVSDLVYKARSHYKRFVAVVGVDDEKGGTPAGSITFEVYADDEPLFRSEVLHASDERTCINVAIPEGAKHIRLHVGDGANGVACDHADWANAGFLTLGAQPVEPDFEPDPGFVSLFDGKSLSGWEADPRYWSVTDGSIHGETTADKKLAGNTFCVWNDGRLKNFVLKLRFRLTNGNSGVQFRSDRDGQWTVKGYQADIATHPGIMGALYEERGRGMLVRPGQFAVATVEGAVQAVGGVADPERFKKAVLWTGWNTYVIAARGNHITQTINGCQTAELIDAGPAMAREGVLALQLHAGPPMMVEFRDIQVRHLETTYGDAVRLFNGESLDGWTFSNEELRGTWSVEQGVLVNEGKPAGYIRTTSDYDHYQLRLQLRHVTKGNSGVLVRMVGPDKVWPRSIEAQGMHGSLGDIWNIGDFPMTVDPARTKGRRTAKMQWSNERPVGEWNLYEITLDGGVLAIEVNGLLQNTATECWQTPGKICIQSEGARVHYRNIVLVPILRPGE